VILLTRTLSILLYYVGQPRVIAEVIGGIILGPSVFGRHIPGFSERVFPQSSLEGLGLVANIGMLDGWLSQPGDLALR
jgi:Kef-type K+ transport system membrane component KefB